MAFAILSFCLIEDDFMWVRLEDRPLAVLFAMLWICPDGVHGQKIFKKLEALQNDGCEGLYQLDVIEEDQKSTGGPTVQ
jgi:hypothetical protein